MKNYELLRTLIEKVEAFENENPDATPLSVENFNLWLINGQKQGNSDSFSRVEEFENPLEINIGSFIGGLYRYVKMYSKKALENSPINTIEEFTFLAVTWERNSISKTDLITRNVIEKTTGMAIIKRLLNLGFLHQTGSETDGRSQMVSLTDEGKNVLMKLFGEMSKVSVIASGQLTKEEKQTLQNILKKLDDFHKNVVDTEKNLDLDEIIAKHVYGKTS
jgi:MarR family transcriptional regulator, lower aerobic nicotinate degradation pathway regulator